MRAAAGQGQTHAVGGHIKPIHHPLPGAAAQLQPNALAHQPFCIFTLYACKKDQCVRRRRGERKGGSRDGPNNSVSESRAALVVGAALVVPTPGRRLIGGKSLVWAREGKVFGNSCS